MPYLATIDSGVMVVMEVTPVIQLAFLPTGQSIENSTSKGVLLKNFMLVNR